MWDFLAYTDRNSVETGKAGLAGKTENGAS